MTTLVLLALIGCGSDKPPNCYWVTVAEVSECKAGFCKFKDTRGAEGEGFNPKVGKKYYACKEN